MDEDQLFELEYHDEMELLAELENGKTEKSSISADPRLFNRLRLQTVE